MKDRLQTSIFWKSIVLLIFSGVWFFSGVAFVVYNCRIEVVSDNTVTLEVFGQVFEYLI